MAEDVLLVDVADRVATVTLNRPAARNALNRDLRAAIPRAVKELEADDSVDVLILTGADPAFCGGLDLKELGSGEHDISASVGSERDRQGPLPRISKPIIGAINGVAVTGGFELALACDFLIASENARFADTHARVGVQPGWGLTVLLPQAVGLKRAKELSTTGNFLDAPTALTWGLVNHVVPHDELLPYCRQLAADIVSNEQAGVRRILRTYDEGSEVTAGEAWKVEARAASDWIRSGEGRADDIERRRKAIAERGRSQVR
ncbi:MAG: enoyl-CoA hydratase [Acidimicrobiaceae bacterium]